MSDWSDLGRHPNFILAAGLGTGLAIGVGIMITYLAKWGKRLFSDIPTVEEPKDAYVCKHHDRLEYMIVDLREGQRRIETKVDQLLIGHQGK